MKHKKVISSIVMATVIMSSFGGSTVSALMNVSASDIQVSTESDDDISINVNDDIVVENENENENDDDDDIKVLSSETSDVDDNSDIQIENMNAVDFKSSVSVDGKKKTVDQNENVDLTVKATNDSDKQAILKLYFCNVDGDVSDDENVWASYLTQPTLNLAVNDMKSDYTKTVKLVSDNGTKVDASLKFLKEVSDDNVVSRYALLELPANTKTEFDLSVVSDKSETVTFIPVMEQSSILFGDMTSVTWEEDISFLDKIKNIIFGSKEDNEETSDDDIIEVKSEDNKSEDNKSDIEVVESEKYDSVSVSTDANAIKLLNVSDFTSMRLMLVSKDKPVIPEGSTVIGKYDDFYLIQFTSIQNAMNGYVYFQNQGLIVEPDVTVGAAGDSIGDGMTVVSMDEADNPIAKLDSMETSDVTSKGVIALIDTGVTSSDKVVDRVSVLDDKLSGNGHGDDMLDDILSQNPDANVLSIRAMDDNGFGTVSSLVAAMEYAIDQKVDMINLSLYARSTSFTSVLKEEIQKAVDAGIIVVGAAGNDGADVIDYVPGSVEDAWIIGAAKDDGSRVDISNFGTTVDYNVVAKTTSEATAQFTGFVSKNGLDAVSKVLNQGWVYATDFKTDDKSDVSLDDEFVKYTYDSSKKVAVKYTFVNADKIKEGDTIDSLYYEYFKHPEDITDVFMGTVLDEVDLYDVGDGTYKFRVDAPLANNYVVGNKYADVIFAHGNNEGEVITKDVSMDMETGVATVDKSVLRRNDDEFADIQCQVMIPVNDIPAGTQRITVENNDGSVYAKKATVQGFVNQSISLDITGSDEDLTSDDFEVYVNGGKTPVPIMWNEKSHELTLSGNYACLLYDVDIKVKKNVNAVFRIAASVPRRNAVFYLKEGTDVSNLHVGDTDSQYVRVSGVDDEYPAYPKPKTVVGSFQGLATFSSVVDGANDRYLGHVGFPKKLFGINFQMYARNGASYGTWTDSRNGTFNGYNSGILSGCNHLSGNYSTGFDGEKRAQFKIIDKWTEGNYTYFTVSVLVAPTADWSSGGQAMGGVLAFAVYDNPEGHLKLQKSSSNSSATYGNGRYSLADAVYGVYSTKSGSTVSDRVGTLTTTTSGKSNAITLEEGTYYVKELSAPEGFLKDDTIHKVVVSSDETYVLYVSDEPKMGQIAITKKSDLPKITNDNKCYSLKGAVYTIYKDSACTESTGKTITTDENGKGTSAKLPLGKYYIKETKASKGFEKDTNKYKADCVEGSTSVTKVNITSIEPVGHDPLIITMTKIQNGPKTEPLPTLEGTQFKICYYDGYYTAKDLPSKPKRTWVIELKKKVVGNMIQYRAGLSDTYLVSDISDNLYKDADENVVIPYGTIMIQEFKAAQGYTLNGYLKDKKGNVIATDNEPYVAQVTKDDGLISLQGGNEFVSEDTPKFADIRIIKYGKDGKTPLKGATFELKDSTGKVVDTQTTGVSGEIIFKDLYPDVYTLTETDVPSGYQLLKEPVTITCPMRVTEEDIKEHNIDKTQCIYDPADDIYYIYNQTFEITNTPSFVMPMTGGMTNGWLFVSLIGGMAIFAGVVVLLVYKKKKMA